MTFFIERYGKALGRSDYVNGRPMILPDHITAQLRVWYLVGWGEAMREPSSYRKRLRSIKEQMKKS